MAPRGTAIAVATAALVICIAIIVHLALAISLDTSPILLAILLSTLAVQLDRQGSMLLVQRGAAAPRRGHGPSGRQRVRRHCDFRRSRQGRCRGTVLPSECLAPIEQVKEKPLEALLPLLGQSYAVEGTLAPRELLAKRSDGSPVPRGSRGQRQ